MLCWIAGVSAALLAASGVVAIVRPIATSYAGIPDENRAALPLPAASPDWQAEPAGALATISRRSLASCSECGVVQSMRVIEHSEFGDRQGPLGAEIAGQISGGAVAPAGLPGKRYEITIRYRDGSAAVFNEARPRTWRLGARVIVIGREGASKQLTEPALFRSD